MGKPKEETGERLSVRSPRYADHGVERPQMMTMLPPPAGRSLYPQGGFGGSAWPGQPTAATILAVASHEYVRSRDIIICTWGRGSKPEDDPWALSRQTELRGFL